MPKLGKLASLVRSKNAGPFELTIDIMFNDPTRYRRVVDSGKVTAETVGAIYRLPASDVRLFQVDNALAIKASIPRPVFQGEIGDSDSHGGQQYAPLLDIEVP